MTRDNSKQLNVRIPKELHKQAKIKAAQTGRPISEVIREKLEEWTREKEPQK